MLCQTPGLASAFFEHGGLTALLESKLLSSSRLHFAPHGLPVLDAPHPAALFLVLRILVAVVGTVPEHGLAFLGVLKWLERHHEALLGLLEWIGKLPLMTSTEPHTTSEKLGLAQLNSAAASAATTDSISARSIGTISKGVLLVLCPQNDDMDKTLEIPSLVLTTLSSFNDTGLGAHEEDRDHIIALAFRCAALIAELWASVVVAMRKCSGSFEVRSPIGPVPPLQAAFKRLAVRFEAAFQILLGQMSSIVPSCFRGAVTVRTVGSDTKTSPEASSQNHDFYPSEATRTIICLHILCAWHHDAGTQQLKALAEERRSVLSAIHPSVTSLLPQSVVTSQTDQPTSNLTMLQTIAAQAQVRTGILCTVFVHTCSELLSFRLTNRMVAEGGQELRGLPYLQFEGSKTRFCKLLIILEMSLHLLHVHLAVLIASAHGTSPSPVPGAPRLTLLIQYLREFRQFAVTVGGHVALTDRLPRGAIAEDDGSEGSQVSDLTFASAAAEKAERLLVELQSL